MMSNDKGLEGAARPAKPEARSASARYVRKLLERAGVHFSITRLKVLEAFFAAAQGRPLQANGISAQDIHHRLSDGGEALSMLSMRQVLRRLVDTGLLIGKGRGRYALNPQYINEIADLSA